MTALRAEVAERFAGLPSGTTRGRFEGGAWTCTIRRSKDGRQAWLWGEALGGPARVSANVYWLRAGPVLKPCEMPAARVEAFILGFAPDA